MVGDIGYIGGVIGFALSYISYISYISYQTRKSLNDSNNPNLHCSLFATGFERSQQKRGDRRAVVAIEDCRGWWAMGRKFIFSHNRATSTSICASRQQPHAD